MSDPTKKLGKGYLPYIPVQKVIEPIKYTFFDTSKIVEEDFIKSGVLEIPLLKAYLYSIHKRFAQYLKTNDRSSFEYEEDDEIAWRVLRKLSPEPPPVEPDIRDDFFQGSNGDLLYQQALDQYDEVINAYEAEKNDMPRTASELKERLGEDLFRNLTIVLHLKEEEHYAEEFLKNDFRYSPSVYEELERRLKKFDVTPENSDSLRLSMSKEQYERLERLYMSVAGRGVAETKAEDAIRLLANLVAFDDGNYIYAISKRFKPHYANPNHVDAKCEAATADGRTDMANMDVGRQLLCGLQDFLKSDVAGTHMGFHAILNRLPEDAWFRLDLPKSIIIEEGRTVEIPHFFQSNVVGANYEVEIKLDVSPEAKGRIVAKYDPFDNRLILRAMKNEDNHEQYVVTLHAKAKADNLERQHVGYRPVVSTRSHVAILNRNEPPQFIAKGPGHINDGDLFCMDVIDVQDPEGDPFEINWEQMGGPAANTVTHDDGRRLCANAAPVDRITKPFEFKVAVTDKIDQSKYPSVNPHTVERGLLVYNVPQVELASGERLRLPPEVIKKLTDPNGRDTEAVTFSTGKFIYIFLRLPEDIEKFTYRLIGSVADEINVVGLSGRIATRNWTPFSKVTGDADVFAYQSVSPLRSWTKPGRYEFLARGRNGYMTKAKVTLEHLRHPIWAEVPIDGEVVIKESPDKTMQLSLGKVEELKPSRLKVPLIITNAIQGGKSPLKLEEEIPVRLTVTGRFENGRVMLQSEVMAKRQDAEGDNVRYMVDFSLPHRYRPRHGNLKMEFSVMNQHDEMASLVADTRISDADSTLFDNISISAPTMTMPFPWLMVNMDVHPAAKDDMLYLMQATHKLNLSSPLDMKKSGRFPERRVRGDIENAIIGRGNDVKRIPLLSKREWARVDHKRQQIQIPLAINGYYMVNRAKSFINHGGHIYGDSLLLLPSCNTSKGCKGEGSWGARITWNTAISVAGIPNYPPGVDMLRYNRTRIATSIPQMQPRDVTRKRKNELRKLLGKVSIRPTANKVNAGQQFSVDLYVPSLKDAFILHDILHARNSVSRIVKTKIYDPTGRRGANYIVGADRVVRVSANTWRYTFRVPKFLPPGEYSAELEVTNPIAAKYTVIYKHKDDPKLYREPYTIDVVKYGKYRLDTLMINGRKESSEAVGRGGVKEINTKRR